jgi:hypothetical protein
MRVDSPTPVKNSQLSILSDKCMIYHRLTSKMGRSSECFSSDLFNIMAYFFKHF